MTPLLSICLPTYNRRDMVVDLVSTLLTVDGRFEICVHVDGSTDGTAEALKGISSPRLRVTVGPNRGRASAMLCAMRAARGRFMMIIDDDDDLFPLGLKTILADCSSDLPTGTVGYIYHMLDSRDQRIGNPFPTPRSNFLALRADLDIVGDKKEVVLAKSANQVAYDGGGRYRRTPTSLVWSRLAILYDVNCRNVDIGRKSYLRGGMTANIRTLKVNNAFPMHLLYRTHCRAFFLGRYRSVGYFFRSLNLLIVYGILSLREPVSKSSA